MSVAALRAGRPIRLDAHAVRGLGSWYLADGYLHDRIVLRDLVVTYPRVTAFLDVVECALPDNGRYHFTAMHAMLAVFQVGVVAATAAHGFTAKPGEIYLRDFALVCRREINQTRGLPLHCELLRAQPAEGAVLYKIAYDFCAGAFSGTLRCLFPAARPEVA